MDKQWLLIFNSLFKIMLLSELTTSNPVTTTRGLHSAFMIRKKLHKLPLIAVTLSGRLRSVEMTGMRREYPPIYRQRALTCSRDNTAVNACGRRTPNLWIRGFHVCISS